MYMYEIWESDNYGNWINPSLRNLYMYPKTYPSPCNIATETRKEENAFKYVVTSFAHSHS